jgi:hypothetical protein
MKHEIKYFTSLNIQSEQIMEMGDTENNISIKLNLFSVHTYQLIKSYVLIFWNNTMKAILIISFVILIFSCSDKNVHNNILTFELRLADTEPDSDLQEMTFFQTDQKFYVHDSVFITNSDLSSAEVIDRETHPKVKVRLTEQGRRKFAEFTSNNIGKHAAMIVDHKLASAPRINAQITKGILLIVGLFNQEEAQTIADGIVP